MNHIRIALCAVLFAAVFTAGARGEDGVDVRALQARLAEQEALLTELEAKANSRGAANANYSGAPEAIVSLNKNALVSIGGQVNTRYYYHSAKVDSIFANSQAPAGSPAEALDGAYRRRAEISQGDLTISDAKLYVDVQVNDHFDAFLQVDLQSSQNAASDNAEKYYIRWKNICNSGFGIKVGRDGLVFGEDFGVGILANYCKSGDGAFKDGHWGYAFNRMLTSGLFGSGRTIWFNNNSAGLFDNPWSGRLPTHNYWDDGRVHQITPYWEFCDGKFSVELSLFQDHSNWDDRMTSRESADLDTGHVIIDGSKYKSRNYGTSVSGRLRWKPVEGLILSASAVNFYDSLKDENFYADKPAARNSLSKNNTAVDLAFNYRPCFLPALQVWGQFLYGWNVRGFKDVDAYTISYGASYDFCENWTVFASGDWLVSKDTYKDVFNNFDDKATMWAFYGGLRYAFGNGVDLEAGWKHEELKLRQNIAEGATHNGGGPRRTTLKGKADTVYAHLGFTF